MSNNNNNQAASQDPVSSVQTLKLLKKEHGTMQGQGPDSGIRTLDRLQYSSLP